MQLSPAHLAQDPPPGGRIVRFAGDQIVFHLRLTDPTAPPHGTRAFLRTSIQTAADTATPPRPAGDFTPLSAAFRDIPMEPCPGGWQTRITLTQVGWFEAKAFVKSPSGWQIWPDGPNCGISVHPGHSRTGNTIYCAFPRMFGPTKPLLSTHDPKLETQLASLEAQGYSTLPPSGKLRDLTRSLPHIVTQLGCRIVQLLPVNPTPTTYARFGRFGSPYAIGSLTAIDPALVDFDKRTTGIEQFEELTRAAHQLGALVFLDMVINHTGWGSTLQEHHPEWFLRNPDGTFTSPGAWGTTWEDLVELNHHHHPLWEELAQAFLTWCRRGVDGFRCDAGYKVPVPVWRYIVDQVRREFPETVFLLEGLGGGWGATEDLLTLGGMQWAYSELFQEFSGPSISGYLDHALAQSARVGTLIHFSETHDNDRLASKGRPWSLLRNRLSALTSVCGGFGFTCGVEWLAPEKINVHSSRGLAWDNPSNIVPELAQLNTLLKSHPCFFDGATLTRLTPANSPVYALHRVSNEGLDHLLVLANTDPNSPHPLTLNSTPSLPSSQQTPSSAPLTRWVDLINPSTPHIQAGPDASWIITLQPGATHCLSPKTNPAGLSGDTYRTARALALSALEALCQRFSPESLGAHSWRDLGTLFASNPAAFLSAIDHLPPLSATNDLVHEIQTQINLNRYPATLSWTATDGRRILPVPASHWILVSHPAPFRCSLSRPDAAIPEHRTSTPVGPNHHLCWFRHRSIPGNATLTLTPLTADASPIHGKLLLLPADADAAPAPTTHTSHHHRDPNGNLVLLTNGRGGMCRLRTDFGTIASKYDCLLGANLHPDYPVDRHVFAKRARLWANANGFISPLDQSTLLQFTPGVTPCWLFKVPAGGHRTLLIQLRAAMPQGENSVVLQLERLASPPDLTPHELSITARIDIEDRSFHWETQRNPGADHHFESNVQPLRSNAGFRFSPAPDRTLIAVADQGTYHPQPEWATGIPHPIEQSRGQNPSGDAYSPGWFELPLPPDEQRTLILSSETNPIPHAKTKTLFPAAPAKASLFPERLTQACSAFVVRRGEGKTVIAGYPWFLDWGRDTLICARGLIAAGFHSDVLEILKTFGRFEEGGTLPNSIHGGDASNRDTTDAPLWFGVAFEELAAVLDSPSPGGRPKRPRSPLHTTKVAPGGRTFSQVLRSIAAGFLNGTRNQIKVDPASALVWSPSHFTWMDTNYPAGTPREGYPVDIQALWIRLLRLLHALRAEPVTEPWNALADKAAASVERLFWMESKGYYSDVLRAAAGVPAASAVQDDALRSNCLLLISLGLVRGPRARSTVQAAANHLLIPGALRSLAPLPVDLPLEIRSPQGTPLNNPHQPYWGHYAGDEDTRRKPAYHNGTGWTWTFPSFCEALALAWDMEPAAVAAARSYLLSSQSLLDRGCLGHLPEVVDGDAPHQERGCDAQAWGVTEALRCWNWLERHRA